MLGSIISATPAISKLLLEFFSDKKDNQELKAAVRDRLKREISFNVALFDLLSGKKNLTLDKLILNLKSDAIEELVTLPFPINKILKSELEEPSLELLKKTENKNHKKWSANIKSEIDLLERIWLRLQVARIRIENNAGVGDTAYLKLLLLTMEKSLRDRNH